MMISVAFLNARGEPLYAHLLSFKQCFIGFAQLA
jgi:hypothetical protein